MIYSTPKILLVDDDPSNIYSLEELFFEEPIEVMSFCRGDEAINAVKRLDFDLALIDVILNNSDGFALAKELKTFDDQLPIVFMSSVSKSEETQLRTFDSGGVDFIERPLQPNVFLAKIKNILNITQQKKALQNLNFKLQQEEKEIRENENKLRLKIEKLEKSIYRDLSTGLYNKEFILKAIDDSIEEYKPKSNTFSLLVLDIDHFKNINDEFGHLLGDDVIKHLASHLKTFFSKNAIVGRFGGDEFVILLPMLCERKATNWAEEFICHLKRSVFYSKNGEAIDYTVSIGIKEFQSGESRDQFFSRADEMLYNAKKNGRNCVMNESSSWGAIYQKQADILIRLKRKCRENKKRMVKDAINIINEFEKTITFSDRCSEEIAETAKKFVSKFYSHKMISSEEIYYGAFFANIGEIGVNSKVLLSKAKLDYRDFQQMQKHPCIGEKLVSDMNLTLNLPKIVRHTHEHYDGSGYPDGLIGEKIPFASRVIFVVDSYFSMLSEKAYKKKYTKEEVVRELEAHRGSQFDSQVVNDFLTFLKDT